MASHVAKPGLKGWRNKPHILKGGATKLHYKVQERRDHCNRPCKCSITVNIKLYDRGRDGAGGSVAWGRWQGRSAERVWQSIQQDTGLARRVHCTFCLKPQGDVTAHLTGLQRLGLLQLGWRSNSTKSAIPDPYPSTPCPPWWGLCPLGLQYDGCSNSQSPIQAPGEGKAETSQNPAQQFFPYGSLARTGPRG